MVSILLQTLALASSGFLSFGSLTIMILLMLSDRGWRNGLAYWLGYISVYAIIGVSVVLLNARIAAPADGSAPTWLPILLFLLGGLLILLSWRNARRPASSTGQPPRFLTLIENITPPKAFGFGALVPVLNFKNLALFLSALTVVMFSRLPVGQKIIVTLLAVLVFCLMVSLPLLIYVLFPRRTDELLHRLKSALERYSHPLGIWAPLVFALLLIIKGISLL
jgi:threonine/homoserine/homoserine lactone efflux protein